MNSKQYAAFSRWTRAPIGNVETPGGAEEEGMGPMSRKGRAFPHSRGRSPLKRHDRSLIWTSLVSDRRRRSEIDATICVALHRKSK